MTPELHTTTATTTATPAMFYAYAWESGLIGLGSRVPKGALMIAKVPKPQARYLRKEIVATARHSRISKRMFVPGVPEAVGGFKKVDALIAYCRWVEKNLEESSVPAARHDS